MNTSTATRIAYLSRTLWTVEAALADLRDGLRRLPREECPQAAAVARAVQQLRRTLRREVAGPLEAPVAQAAAQVEGMAPPPF